MPDDGARIAFRLTNTRIRPATIGKVPLIQALLSSLSPQRLAQQTPLAAIEFSLQSSVDLFGRGNSVAELSQSAVGEIELRFHADLKTRPVGEDRAPCHRTAAGL